MVLKVAMVVPAIDQDMSEELDTNVKKYLRGESANLEGLQDKKLKGQLAVREELYGRSAKAAAKVEKWLLPSEGGHLECEGIEKTWRIKQDSIAREVDILSSRNQYDIVLPGSRFKEMGIGSASVQPYVKNQVAP